VKVISDTVDFNLLAVDRFVSADGRFQSVRFACYVALRPWQWGTTISLARSSGKASRALSDALTSYLDRETHNREALPDESLVAALNPIKAGPKSASGHTFVGPEIHTGAKRQQ
jgi:hypothetical protein